MSEERLSLITIVEEKDILLLQPGEVTHDGRRQTWFIGCPLCHEPGGLAAHTTIYHDGLLTVSPSILCRCGAHYFVEHNHIRWV